MSERIGMIYKLERQNLKNPHTFNSINPNDINELAISMLDAFIGTEDFHGETVEELGKEIRSVVESTFGTFIPDASLKIEKNGEIASTILISLYKGKPFVSELFTRKEYMNLGMATGLLKKSINTLISLGYNDLVLYVHPKNIEAINLYKKIGFIEL